MDFYIYLSSLSNNIITVFKLCSRHCLLELSDVIDGVDDRHEVPRPEKLEQPEHVEEEVEGDADKGEIEEDGAVAQMSLP